MKAKIKPFCKTCPTPRAPDKCGPLAALLGQWPQTADSASGGFVRQFPRLPVTPAVGLLVNIGEIVNEEQHPCQNSLVCFSEHFRVWLFGYVSWKYL